MSDNWNIPNNEGAGTPPTPPVSEPAKSADPVIEPVKPVEPVAEPVKPVEPVAPVQPVAPPAAAVPPVRPVTAVPPVQPVTVVPPVRPATPATPNPVWNSDGTYRYVPPANTGYTQPAGTYPRYPQPGQPVPPPQPPIPEPPKKKKNGFVTFLVVLGVIATVALFVVGCILLADGLRDGDQKPADDPGTSESAGNENLPSLEVNTWDTDDGGLSAEEIVKRNFDSTVVLTMYSRSSNFFFGESNLTEAGAASGIVMTADGYIITNRHCVINEYTGEKYERIDVTTYDGTVYEDAQVIGVDEATDLAVIRVEATNLTPAKFGDSDELEVGARVVALGNAAGLSWTATQGIVSAKARDVYDDTGYAIKCLQVDAAINSGNSGGPLLNKQGLVVGINSAKIAATGYEGLGFAIPINEAKVVIDSLVKNGYVSGRVALGITGQTIDSGMYKGFMIASIEEGSCLEGTEAKVNDLIVEINGVTVTDYGTLRAELAKYQVGDRVKLKLLRSDQRTGEVTSLTVTVTLNEQKGE